MSDTKGKCFRCIIRGESRPRAPPRSQRLHPCPCPRAPIARRERRPWRGCCVARRCACALALAGPGSWQPAARAEQAARARRYRLGRLQRRHRAQDRRRDHARDPRRPRLRRRPAPARIPADASGIRWSPPSRQLGNITADIDQRFAWEPFLVRDPSVNAFALPGGFVGVHLGLIAHHVDARRARLGARARDVARLAAPHRAQHLGRLEALAGRPRGAGARPARRVAQPQPRRDERGRRRHAGGDDPGPAQLLARHGARGRPRRLPGDDVGRLRAAAAWRRCSRRWTTRCASTTSAAFPTCAATR